MRLLYIHFFFLPYVIIIVGLFDVTVGSTAVVSSTKMMLSRMQRNSSVIRDTSDQSALLKMLEESCPDMTRDVVHTKFTFTRYHDNPIFRFYRSFPAFFYLQYKVHMDKLDSLLQNISLYKGYVVGDAHPENFGMIMDAEDKLRFTLNDVDDFGRGYLAADVMRFLVGCTLSTPQVNLPSILASYLKGVTGAIMPDTSFVIGLHKKAKRYIRKGLPLPDLSMIDHSAGGVRIRRTEEVTNCENHSAIPEVLMKMRQLYGFQEDDKYDIACTDNVEGGSGGRARYIVVMAPKDKKDNKYICLIEFKQIGTSSVFPLFAQQDQPAVQIARALKVVLKSGFHPWFKADHIGGTPFLLRPLFASHFGVKVAKLDISEIAEAVHQEAYELGLIHKYLTSSNDASIMGTHSWSSLVSGVQAKHWKEAVDLLSETLTSMWIQLDKIISTRSD
jgi:hypothetical protein